MIVAKEIYIYESNLRLHTMHIVLNINKSIIQDDKLDKTYLQKLPKKSLYILTESTIGLKCV